MVGHWQPISYFVFVFCVLYFVFCVGVLCFVFCALCLYFVFCIFCFVFYIVFCILCFVFVFCVLCLYFVFSTYALVQSLKVFLTSAHWSAWTTPASRGRSSSKQRISENWERSDLCSIWTHEIKILIFTPLHIWQPWPSRASLKRCHFFIWTFHEKTDRISWIS